MTLSAEERAIRTRPQSSCYLCGSPGITSHRDLHDALSATPGSWSFRRCPNPDCGLLWQDPMPVEEDIAKAYDGYFTHRESQTEVRAPAHRLKPSAVRTARNGLRTLPLLRRLYEEHRRRDRLYLTRATPGRVLEVGCGNGHRLVRLRALGWEVAGQEVDPIAAEIARRAGIPVYGAPLHEIHLDESTFDAVLLIHVLEHVHNPVGLLRTCHGILRPGGELVVVTPNSSSYGHAKFGRAWSGLDPPRHLFLMSEKTLREIARRAGFTSIEIGTSVANAMGILAASRNNDRSGRYGSGTGGPVDRFVERSYQGCATLAWLANEHTGEECVLRAIRTA